jgi:hypothetical protein
MGEIMDKIVDSNKKDLLYINNINKINKLL